MANIEKYQLTGSARCKESITKHPDYRVFWRSGFAFRGAGESEVTKDTKERFCSPYFDEYGKWHNKKVMTFEETMQQKYNWAAAIDIEIDHDKKEIHMNGFSENDLY